MYVCAMLNSKVNALVSTPGRSGRGYPEEVKIQPSPLRGTMMGFLAVDGLVPGEKVYNSRRWKSSKWGRWGFSVVEYKR
jgi:hypothetical protein